MSTDFKQETIDIIKYFQDNWTYTDLALPNIPFEIDEKEEWSSIEFITGDMIRISMGAPEDNTNRHTSVIRIKVYVKQKTGVARLNELVDFAINLLSWVVLGNIKTRNAQPRSGGTVGQFEQMIIDVGYTVDYNF